MIIIGLGANLSSEVGGPQQTLEFAIDRIDQHVEIKVIKRSGWYRSAAVPVSDQPDFVNGAIAVKTPMSPHELLNFLLSVEQIFGRIREERWSARCIDLDLIDYNGLVKTSINPGSELELPHPRLHERLFVLLPLAQIKPDWQHPISHIGVADLIAKASKKNEIHLIDD